MTEIEYSGNKLTVGNESIELPEPINECIEFDGLVVVQLDTLGKSNYARNVWAFDKDGGLKWKVEPVEPTDGSEDPYTNISIRDGDLWAWNWDGHRYKIDVSTGEITDQVFTK